MRTDDAGTGGAVAEAGGTDEAGRVAGVTARRSERGERTPGRSAPGRSTPGWAERFEALAEHVFDATVVVRADGTIVEASDSIGALFGYDGGDAVGFDILDVLDDDGAVAMRSCFEEFVARRRLTLVLDLRVQRADRTWIDVEVVAANHLDDHIEGIVVHLRDLTEHQVVTDRVREAELRHATIIDSLVDGVMMVNARGVIVRVNPAFEAMFGAPAEVMLGRRLAEVLALSGTIGVRTVDGSGHPVSADDHPLLQSLATGERHTGVIHGITRWAEPTVWIRINSQAMFGAHGDVPTGAVASFSDITEGRNATVELRREEQFLQTLLDNVEEGIVACDGDGRITMFNPAAKRLHGMPDTADPTGKVPTSRRLRLGDGTPLPPGENPLTRAIAGDRVRDLEVVITAQSGEERLVSVNGQQLLGEDGRTIGAVVVLRDITEQKRNEERLAELALHDPLTGLANRILLGERLRAALSRERQSVAGGEGDGSGVAVFLLDLDAFKEINDKRGHDVGDDVLVAVGRRLLATVRPTDTVARLGGDEFVVLCDVRNGKEELDRIAERIRESLSQPYRIDGRTLAVGASVGGVLADPSDTDPSKLLSRADDAMYQVKWSRGGHRRSMLG